MIPLGTKQTKATFELSGLKTFHALLMVCVVFVGLNIRQSLTIDTSLTVELFQPEKTTVKQNKPPPHSKSICYPATMEQLRSWDFSISPKRVGLRLNQNQSVPERNGGILHGRRKKSLRMVSTKRTSKTSILVTSQKQYYGMSHFPFYRR